jgi:hypothetical protein
VVDKPKENLPQKSQEMTSTKKDKNQGIQGKSFVANEKLGMGKAAPTDPSSEKTKRKGNQASKTKAQDGAHEVLCSKSLA